MDRLLVLLLAASCTGGQFHSLFKDHVTSKEDSYTDGFDGSCDFEKDACQWKDTSKDAFRWRLEKANISKIPGVDHTTGSPWGQIMHVNGSSPNIFSEAILEHTFNQSTALGCQISFWYHLHDSTGISSHFVLSLVSEGSSVVLWNIKKGQTDGWENASVRVGNRPKAFKMVFSVDPTYIGEQDVMLDDIKLTGCAEGDVPAGSELLSCDFEKDVCGWYSDYSTSLTWQRTNGRKPSYDNQGPGYDHTTGSGYYMYIAPTRSSNPSQTARLVSYPQQGKCISFWYHIYGGSIGSLRFIYKNSDGAETVMWMRTGNQGNKWRFAELSFADNDSPVQFILEGVLGGTDGSIAIDDIQVSSSVNNSCPAEKECTFESGLCGLKTEPAAQFPWIRTTGEQTAGTASPNADHTLGTDQGYYLSAQLWKYPPGSRGSVVTRDNEPTAESGVCWMFWYHMAGKDGGTLSVYLQQSHSSTKVPLWSRSIEQGERWRHSRATAVSPHYSYQIVFEAVVGEGQVKDIAIDDLSVLNGPCSPNGLCDFEMDECGWVNSALSGHSVPWSWTSGASGFGFSPEVDHTTNSALGHYMAFDSKYDRNEQVAHLQSELMPPVDHACLEFWYYMNMWGTVDKLTLDVYVNESGTLHFLWNKTGAQGKVWNKVNLDYRASENYQIVFEARRPPYDEGVIALDDIYIKENTGCSDLIPTTPAPTTEPTTPPPSAMDCSFEEGLCDWVQEAEHGLTWNRQQGLQVDTSTKGPLYDHTTKNSHGFYLLLNMSGDKDEQSAVISAPVTIETPSVCVEFWYYMLGTRVESLDLLVQTKTAETVVVWTRKGTEAAEWLNGQVTLSMNDIQRVKLSGSRNANSSGFIAIDDVRVSPGACKDHNSCGFEDASLCGFEHDVTDSTHWSRVDGSTGHIDHTYRSQLGHSMAVLGKDILHSASTHLLTPEYSKTTETCVRFWYWLSAGPADSLAVHVYLNGELGPTLWSLSGVPSTGWEVAEVTVSSPSKFRVAFKADISPAQKTFILLDDVSVRDGACSPRGSCDFESGSCTWMNAANRDSDGHDWVHSDGHSLGPPIDQTTHTAYGRFMLSPSQAEHSSRAVLISERILQNSNSCFTFWYHINNSDSGTLRVFLDAEKGRELMFETSVAEYSWRNFSTTVFETNPFQIRLEAESGKGGFIAVDDVTITKGLCEDEAVESGRFVGCQFETDSCGWTDVSVGQFVWQRDHNGTTTANTGPSVDHTTGTELGWYMAVEASHGDQNSYAALQSPAMKQASAECVLEFYYHMYGEGIGELKVFLQEGPRRTILWWKSGDHGDEWLRAEVAVGRTHQVFTILFEATRTFSELGDIAIDDLAFINCSLPGPQDSCPTGTFTCSNRVCVEPSRVCDFSDDCGDGSDEAHCDELGYKQRCSFEQGMCSWQSNEGWDGWSLQSGERAWPVRGPPRDHTRNTAAGHFIVPVHHHSASQTAEIMSSTLLPSSECTVIFYHYAHGNNSMAGLTAQLRRLRGGEDDIILWGQTVTHGFHWQRVEVTFSSSVKAKIVFRFVGSSENREEFITVDDVSFSPGCVHDPDNSQLPETPPTLSPSTPTAPLTTPTPTDNPCKENEFYCWRSSGMKCIASTAQCDYSIDCPLGEDEETCGPCTFENGLCDWSDISQNVNKWLRVKADDNTDPPADHTTGTGHYVHVNFSPASSGSEAQFQSPSLPTSSPYCQILFHFHLGSGGNVGDLSVFLQSDEGRRTQLWTRNHSTATPWSLEYLAIGKQPQPYRIIFSSQTTSLQSAAKPEYRATALDDISFLNCETSYQPPALSAIGCSFEKDLCGWVQGSAEDLHWLRKSGPTETVNTGPAGDHTSSKGYYVYVESSSPNRRGQVAQLKSPPLPPAGEKGYCLQLWYHMFGATVGSLKLFLKNVSSRKTTLMWQRTGSHENKWQLVQSHVTLQEVHQILIDASVGGEAGDIAIDDISLTEGACITTDGLCDFEEGSCGWTQQADDDLDWIRGSGVDPVLNTKPSVDHTTYTDSGHYYYMGSDSSHVGEPTARMSSPLFIAGDKQCLHVWYYMSGMDGGTLNVYQELSGGAQSLLLSHSGEQGKLWRFSQAPLPHTSPEYRIVVEGVKQQSEQGVMAVDDIMLSTYPCTGPDLCDFEVNMCGWRNVLDEDDTDWLRDQGNTKAPSTGPSIDHTTNSSVGYYLYVDITVGTRGSRALLLSEIFPADSTGSTGQCFTFWYHTHGYKIGTLNLYINNRTTHSSGNKLGHLMWTESGDQGDVWWRSRVDIHNTEPFWFVFQYQKGEGSAGSVALDDLHITPGPCDPVIEPPTTAAPPDVVGIGVGVTVMILVIAIACTSFYILRRRKLNREPLVEHDMLESNVAYDLYDCELEDTES